MGARASPANSAPELMLPTATAIRLTGRPGSSGGAGREHAVIRMPRANRIAPWQNKVFFIEPWSENDRVFY